MADRETALQSIRTRYSNIHLAPLGSFLEQILRSIWEKPAYKIVIAASANPARSSPDERISFSFNAIASTPNLEMCRYEDKYVVDKGDEDSDTHVYCKKWLEGIAKQFSQVEGMECRLEDDKLVLSYQVDKDLKSHWGTLARIALADFSEQKGERVGVGEIKKRLGKLREAKYTIEPYGRMKRKEVLRYFIKICNSISSEAKRYCPEVLDEIERKNGRLPGF